MPISAAQYHQRMTNNKETCLIACQQTFDHLPQEVILTFQGLGRPSRHKIDACIKFGFMEKPGYNKYILHYPRKEEE